jgi:acetyltransferase-like isoleucine patch superfamily enzyme
MRRWFRRCHALVDSGARRLRGLVLARLVFGQAGSNLRLGRGVRVTRGERILLGEEVSIGPLAELNVEQGGDGPAIRIGDRSSLGAGTIISAANVVEIGSCVTIAARVLVTDHQHMRTDTRRPIAEQGITEPRPVRIHHGAWLGVHAVIMPGVTIGENAVVGANSVVTHSVEPGKTVIGAPARSIDAA